MVIVFRHYARTEFPEPFQLVLDAITPQVEMDAVLHDLWLGYQLEEDPRLPARRLDQDVRIVLRVKDALTAQPRELRLIVRSDLVTVEDGCPEPGDRRGMAAIKYNIVKASHCRIMPQPQPAVAPARSSPRTQAAISPPRTPGLCAAGYSLNRSCPAQRVAPGRVLSGELNQRPGQMTFSYRSCSTYVNSPECANRSPRAVNPEVSASQSLSGPKRDPRHPCRNPPPPRVRLGQIRTFTEHAGALPRPERARGARGRALSYNR